MRLAICGPNGINDATFHVHAADCADVRKHKYDRSETWEADFTAAEGFSLEDTVVLDLFSDFIEENDYTDDEAAEVYANEVRFFPCVRGGE